MLTMRVVLLAFCCFSGLVRHGEIPTVKQAHNESAIEVLRHVFADANSEIRYYSANVDLNGDGVDEMIVYVYGNYICGTGGCETVVLSQSATGFRVVSRIALSRPPILVLPQQKNSWRSLAVFVSGGGIQPGYFAELRFNGKAYPEDPSGAPALAHKTRPEGITVIPEFPYARGKILIRAKTKD